MSLLRLQKKFVGFVTRQINNMQEILHKILLKADGYNERKLKLNKSIKKLKVVSRSKKS